MLCTNNQVVDFWCMPWSQTFRRANVWLERFGQPLTGKKADKYAPKWLRPLFVQRWVGETVARRLAWMEGHPERAEYRYGRESEPSWEGITWLSEERGILRQFGDDGLLLLLGMEVERLLRIAQEHPSLVGQVEWTQATLAASEHVAKVYGELRRRHKAARARAMVQEALRGYELWGQEEERNVG